MILPISYSALDEAMPLHVVFGADWRVAHAGPTLLKLCGSEDPIGRPLTEVFDISEHQHTTIDPAIKRPIPLTLRLGRRPRLRGTAVELGEQTGAAKLVNLSLHVTEWNRPAAAQLTIEDFAPNDLVIDMLYLIEAKSNLMDEALSLIGTLQGKADSAGQLAITDTLTGLLNRRALERAMDRAIDRGTPFALTQLDLDYFKAVNDTHGHAAGDAVLRHVANVLRANTRSSDTVARVGGDEFVLLLMDQSDPKIIDRIARRIITEIEEPVTVEGVTVRISTSLGTALSTDYDQPDGALMLGDADKALYTSKAAGRGAHTIWPIDVTLGARA